MTEHQLTRADARRIAVQAHLLAEPRPGDLMAVVRHLTHLQHDPISAVAPSADLVLWSRLGSSYDVAELRDALDRQELIDHLGLLRPAEDLALYRAEMAHWPGRGPLRPWQEEVRDWVEANDECRLDVLERLRADGPLPISELPDTCQVPWASSGWNNDKNLQQLLRIMARRGEVATAGRTDRERLWDLAERIYPDDPVPDADEAERLRDGRRLTALGIARSTSPAANPEAGVGGAGEPAVVEGVRGSWRVDPSLLDRALTGRAALLSPLDRLVYDRKRALELFEFDYQLEMYKPAAKRRWGYYALPILYADRLVGKLDATADRADGVLRVDAVHEDVPFTGAMAAAVDEEIDDLARWLGLEVERTG
ncbi:DNA glycosylase AlkZ-like family protein [uncultured Nocardioides sp.]|uniref:Cytoplasmic protein clustered with trehalase n=1 Tax=uncultured Nocardioides sp. TaxID=198441 RepID=A0A6J4PBJ0_9ACTN|nr:crosslink repair DNA glycosylase YcaQ family protein [uncultured Nocardioides sp.]CAA9405522.1 MAG: Putative cytoplasmic protein clustered with trehalase [uncultured Nocardioides sp.]